jgi:flagellar motor switch protein FliM
MTAPLLSPEEVAALRTSEGGEEAKVVPIDLHGSERAARKALAALDRLLIPVTAGAQRSLGRALQAPCSVDSKPAEVVGPQAAATVIETQVQSARIQAGAETVALVGVELSLAFALVESAFGAAVSEAPASPLYVPERHRLTQLELKVVAPTLLGMADLLASAFQAEGAPLKSELLTQTFELPPSCDYVVLWRLEVKAGAVSGSITTTALPALLGALRNQSGASLASPNRSRMTSLLRSASLELSADLGSTELSVAELLALRAGDVLRLDRSHADLLPVSVEGVAKLWGRPIQRNGVFGIEVVKEFT